MASPGSPGPNKMKNNDFKFSGDPRESSSGRSCRSKSRRWREERANARDEREVTVYGNSLRNANNQAITESGCYGISLRSANEVMEPFTESLYVAPRRPAKSAAQEPPKRIQTPNLNNWQGFLTEWGGLLGLRRGIP